MIAFSRKACLGTRKNYFFLAVPFFLAGAAFFAAFLGAAAFLAAAFFLATLHSSANGNFDG